MQFSSKPFIVVGLGNPGWEYAETRHNFGFRFLDYLQQKIVPVNSFKYVKEFQAEICTGQLVNRAVCLVKPQTFMNLSGRTVRALISDSAVVDIQKVLIVYDDLDLPLGRIKLKKSGGDGGHNGIKSIIESLASSNFMRMRLGISGPLRGDDTIDYVLSPFSESEVKTVTDVINRGVAGVLQILTSGVDSAMNQVNRQILEQS